MNDLNVSESAAALHRQALVLDMTITEALLRLGYSDDDVRGFLGENWMRVLEQVWR